MVIHETTALSDELFFVAIEVASIRLPAEFSMQFAYNAAINGNDDGLF
jgi:hypothetical protein